MYVHVVMFRIADKARVDEAAAMLRTLEGNVPTLRSVEVGQDDSPTDRSSDLVLITRFDSRADYEAYHHHPFHQELLGRFVPLVSEARKVDYAQPGSAGA